ncbi:MAG: hypothetical protein WC551_02910 [Patescibacteria group bacterium]
MPSSAAGRLNTHVQKIFEALAPDIGAWRIIGVEEGKGHCACGHHIEVASFVLKRPGHAGEVYIGPTCIDETIPFLAKMTSHERAHAMEIEWREQLIEFRRQRALREGTSKLMAILPVAAAMDEWFEATKERFADAGSKLQPYFFQRRNRRLGELGMDEPTDGDRAKRIANNLSGFRDHLPLLRKAAVAAKIEWTEAPTCFDVSEDWFEARLEVERVRDKLTPLVRRLDLTRLDRETLYGVLPSKLSQLKTWLKWARDFETGLAEYPKLKEELKRKLAAGDGEDLPELEELRSNRLPKDRERFATWLSRVRVILTKLPSDEVISQSAAQAKAERERIAEVRRQEDARRREELQRAEQARYEAWKRQEAERLRAEQARREELQRQETERLAAQRAQRRHDLENEIAELRQEYKCRADKACYRLSFKAALDTRGRSQFEACSIDCRTLYVLRHIDLDRCSIGEVCLCNQERVLVDTDSRRVVLVGLQANVTRFERLVARLESELNSLRD